MCYEDETACDFGNVDFIDDLNLSNWGWNNGPLGEGTYERVLYATKDMLPVGNVTIEYLDGCVTVFYNLDPGFELMETHVWISESSPLPFSMRKGEMIYNSAPGQLGYYGDTEYCGFEGDLYFTERLFSKEIRTYGMTQTSIQPHTQEIFNLKPYTQLARYIGVINVISTKTLNKI